MAENVPDVYVRLDGLKGECTDEKHPGKDGWVQIKGFNFGFGLKSADSGLDTPFKKGMKPEEMGAAAAAWQKAQQKNQKDGKKGKNAKDEGPFDRPDVTLSKTLDLASPSIWKEKCHSGDIIPKIEVVACRYGGEELGEEKIPFLTLVFEKVQVKSVSMGVSADELPSESIHFRYDAVKVKYIWTANDRGSRIKGAAAPRAGWNFEQNKPVEWGPKE